MSEHEHTLSPGCWCGPVVVHVPRRGPAVVTNARDSERLAELGVTNIVVSPDVPAQRGGENGDK